MINQETPVHIYNCADNCNFSTDRTREHLLHHVQNHIPTKINYGEINIMPCRHDFIDRTIANAIDTNVAASKPILFMPTSIVDRSEWDKIDRVSKYCTYIYGILPCGRKTLVILEGAEVSFDVKSIGNIDQFKGKLKVHLKDDNYTAMKSIKLYPLHGFQEEPSDYIRIIFNTIKERKQALTILSDPELSYELANNDTGMGNFYFNKVARENKFNTADWNRIEKYTAIDASTVSSNCAFAFRVKIDDYRKLPAQKRKELSAPNSMLTHVIDRDNTMIKVWDIETHRTIENGSPPTINDMDWTIFMICSAYFWYHSAKPYMTVCVVDVECHARDGVDVTIICGVESNVILSHIDTVSGMAPDITAAFNGANFDWWLLREKIRRNNKLQYLKQKFSSEICKEGGYGMSDKEIMDWSFRSAEVKIAAGDVHNMKTIANFAGMLDTDVMPVFMIEYPRRDGKKSASLNYFLSMNNLESKEDMPYQKMFRIYERSLALRAVTACHCNQLCAICTKVVRDIDRTEINGIAGLEHGDLHPDIVNKCCFCGKLPRNLNDMSDVAKYCAIDCLRPQELYVKRTIVSDKRGLSNMACVTLQDSFYRANGMKVRNLIGKYCHKWNISFPNGRNQKSKSDKDHFPGAHVFAPNRGLHSDGKMIVKLGNVLTEIQCRPIFGHDFNSLYPSLMMAFNISPDRLVYTITEAERLKSLGYNLYRIEPFDYERGEEKDKPCNQKLSTDGWTVRHNGIATKSGDHIVSKYEKEIINDGVRRVKYNAIKGRAALKNERIGIFPYILKKLFDKRVPVKAEFMKWKNLLETAEKNNCITVSADGAILQLHDAEFNMNKADSTQKALKVLANTFYGEAGNYMSGVYSLLVAAGITTAGQFNIKMISEFDKSLGYGLHYGDTDSAYLSAPQHMFEKCDAEYGVAMAQIHKQYANVPNIPLPIIDTPEYEYKEARINARRIWWTEQVRITMHAAAILTELVYDKLIETSGGLYLRKAYEEVLFPTVLTGMKKYFGEEHVKEIKFDKPKKFIKGIDIIKQGQTGISIILGSEFIEEVLSVYNERSMMDIAMDKIRKFYTMPVDMKNFIQSAKYKSDSVKNIPVRKFVARMRKEVIKYSDDPITAAMYEPPEPGDKFEFVIIKRDDDYDLRAKKIVKTKGDKMEYVKVYLAHKDTLQLDLTYYMTHFIVGLFARFVSYCADFQPPEGMYDINTREGYSKLDEYCNKNAAKFFEDMGNAITGTNSNALTVTGRAYRVIANEAKKYILSESMQLHGKWYSELSQINIHAETGTLFDQIKIFIDSVVTIDSGYGQNFVTNCINSGETIATLKMVYDSMSWKKQSAKIVDIVEDNEAWIKKNISAIACALHRMEDELFSLIIDMRSHKFGYIIKNYTEQFSRRVINAITMSVEDEIILQELYSRITKIRIYTIIQRKNLSISTAVKIAGELLIRERNAAALLAANTNS